MKKKVFIKSISVYELMSNLDSSIALLNDLKKEYEDSYEDLEIKYISGGDCGDGCCTYDSEIKLIGRKKKIK